MSLRRSGPLPRYTRLRSSTPLVQGQGLQRRTPLRAARVAPAEPSSSGRVRTEAEIRRSRTKPMSREEKRARELVKARSGGVCEGCGQARAAEWAHRVRRNAGPWCPANGLHLCNDRTARPGRRGCHEWSSRVERAQGEALGWVLRTTRDYLTTPVQHAAHGLVWLLPDGSVTPTERSAA